MTRRSAILKCSAALVGLLVSPQALAAPIPATLYKNPQCGCCEGYAAYLRKNGFVVTVIPSNDLHLINQKAGVPAALEGCHATIIEGYVVEGHMPIDAINRLLKERPKIVGISIPGMPMGLPGMEGPRWKPIDVYEIAKAAAAPKVFTTIR